MIETDTGPQDVKRMALRGGFAKLLSQAGNFFLRFVFMIVMARLLRPEDFGLVAMVTAFTGILQLFGTAGLSVATVQRSTISNEQISTLFWVNILVGVALSISCVLIAPLVVAFYHEPHLFWVTAAMGTAFLFNAAGVQHLALLQRHLRYVAIAAIEFSCQLASLGIGICVAIAGYGYWALVAAAIALPLLMTASVWVAAAWIPGKPSRNAGIMSLLHFGGTVTVNGIVSYLTYNFDKFILGRVWGESALGQYSLGSQLINIPTSNLNMAIGGVLFSALSRVQHDAGRFRSYFLKAYSLNVSMTLPVTIFSGVFANDIIYVVLGPKWGAAAAIFRLLAPAVLVFGIINPTSWLLWSSGRAMRSLKIAVVISVMVITACFIGLPYGPKGVAIGFSAAMLLWLVPHVVWCLRDTTISPLDLFWAASRPLLSAIVATVLAYAAHAYLGELRSQLFRLVVECSVMAVVYSYMLLFVMGQKDTYLNLLKGIGVISSPASGANNVDGKSVNY